MSWGKRWLFLLPVVLAAAVLVVSFRIKSAPSRDSAAERVTPVRVVGVVALPVVPRVTGYGATRAARSWEAVAEVAGPVTWVSDALAGGRLVPAGTQLLRIDESRYRLALTQIEAQLAAQGVRDRATRASLAIERRSQELARADLDRKRRLEARGALPAAALEEAERAFLRGEVQVQSLSNALSVSAAERDVLEVQKAVAALDLERTRFSAPFDVRIVERHVDAARYANKGQLLFSGDATDAVEVVARFPIGRLEPLLRGMDVTAGSAAVNDPATSPGWHRLRAVVRLRTPTRVVQWPARVDRMAGFIDPQTQTQGVVVVVDDPYGKAKPGERPPLVRNTQVEVELRRDAVGASLVIPAVALQHEAVRVVGAEGRLEIRPVVVAYLLGRAAVIESGLVAGERVVVSGLQPAVPGMALEPVDDDRLAADVEAAATGRSAP